MGEGVPSIAEILIARRLVNAHLAATPTILSRQLSEIHARSIYLKLENLSPIRSFKARGALAVVNAMTADERARGVVTASTGNHGQGMALAAERFNVRITVVVPTSADAVKVSALQRLGAQVVVSGETLNDSVETAKNMARLEGLQYVEDGLDARLMAGAATVLWEMLEAEPQLDSVLVPVGSGNLLASTLLVAAALCPRLSVVGVQSTAAPAATLSWLQETTVVSQCRTLAGGLATDRPGDLALRVMTRHLERMLLVTDDDLWRAIGTAYEATGFAIEAAGVAGLAALEAFPDQIPGKRVGVVITGGWISSSDLAGALGGHSATSQ